jgi:chromosome partitioning protein
VLLSHAYHEAGKDVVLIDADPGRTSINWHDTAPFDFRVFALPTRRINHDAPKIIGTADEVVIDAPQMEDHAGIGRSAIMLANRVIIPVAPSPSELERMGAMRKELEDLEPFCPGQQVFVLLNRRIPSSNNAEAARDFLTEAGWTVLDTVITNRVDYQRAGKQPVDAQTINEYEDLRIELDKRGAA